jgi:hypothetical protein
VLSAAWNVVTVGGKSRLLVPKLATGVKQWHLRPESDFYPKANFQNAVRSIPDGSDVSQSLFSYNIGIYFLFSFHYISILYFLAIFVI